MRFAYSPHGTAIYPQVFAWLGQVLDGGNQVYALLDGSMLSPDNIHSLDRLSANFEQALINSPFESYGLQGPLLWRLESADSKALRALLRRTDGIPALSFITTPPNATLLSETLLWLAVSHTEDSQKLHCRFADTRTLPTLLECLKPEQKTVLGEAIVEWAWLSRDGSLQKQSFAPFTETQSVEPKKPLSLDAAQFDFMLTRAEPDMVFQMLAEQMPEVLPETPAHELHTRLVHMLGAARGHGITDLPGLFQYAVVGLGTCDNFDQHVTIRDTWQRITKEGLLFSELAEQWPEDVWQMLGQPTHAANPVTNLG